MSALSPLGPISDDDIHTSPVQELNPPRPSFRGVLGAFYLSPHLFPLTVLFLHVEDTSSRQRRDDMVVLRESLH